MAKQGISDGGLRVGVKGGGCSGLSYTFSWDREPRLGDEVFEGPDGAKIFVDKLTKVVRRLREMSPLYEMVKEGVDLSKMQWVTH